MPFYLRTGKALAGKSTEIVLVFRKVPHLLFEQGEPIAPNWLSLCIQPRESIRLGFETKVPGESMSTSAEVLEFSYLARYGKGTLADAYERLLLDAIHGDASLFARNDEVERAWQLAGPLIAACAPDQPEPTPYEPGTWGPQQADELPAKDGNAWQPGCSSPDGEADDEE